MPDKIPKIIHQIWVGDMDAMPSGWMQTWKDKHPDWEYKLWDNDAVWSREWKNQRLINDYRSSRTWHGVADVVRYEILHEFGGFVAPADSECVKPIDKLLEIGNNDIFTCYECPPVYGDRLTPILGCTMGNELMGKLVDGLQDVPPGEPWVYTGNMYLTNMVAKEKYPRLTIYPNYYFFPEHHQGYSYKGKNFYSRHHYGTTLNSYAGGRSNSGV